MRKPTFERLEDRRVLATLNVSLDTDIDVPQEDGALTLREAVNYSSGTWLPLPGEFSVNAIDETLDDLGVNDVIDLTNIAGEIELVHGQMNIKRSVTITGPGRDLLTIDADSDGDGVGKSRIFEINDFQGNGPGTVQNVTLSGLTLTGGNGGSGGAIYSRETLHLDHMRFVDNSGFNGGAINFSSSGFDTVPINFDLDDVEFYGNTATGFGGAIAVEGAERLQLTNVAAWLNSADSSGGAVYYGGNGLEGQLDVIGGKFHTNCSGGDGGAIYAASASLTIDDSEFGEIPSLPSAIGNTSNNTGGALYWVASTGPNDSVVDALISESQFRGNESMSSGGGLALHPGVNRIVEIHNSVVNGNEAGKGPGFFKQGGGVYLHSAPKALLLDEVAVEDNVAGAWNETAAVAGGGGLFLNLGQAGLTTDTTIRNSRIANNQSSGEGGGVRAILQNNSTLRIESSEFEGNRSGDSGGGLYVENGVDSSSPPNHWAGTFELKDSIVSGNQVYTDSAYPHNSEAGGGLFLLSYATLNSGGSSLIERTTFAENSSGSGGGGISATVSPLAPLTIRSSSILSNHTYGDGGGLSLKNEASGVAATEDHIVVHNSTIAKNTAKNGGGIATDGAGTHFSHSTITDNIAGPQRFAEQGGPFFPEEYTAGGGVYFTGFRETGPNNQAVTFDHTIVAGNEHACAEPVTTHPITGELVRFCTPSADGYGGTNYQPELGGSFTYAPSEWLDDGNPSLPFEPLADLYFRYSIVGSLLGPVSGSIPAAESPPDVIIAAKIPDADIAHDTSMFGYSDQNLAIPVELLFQLDGQSRPKLADNGGPTKTVQLAYWGEHLALDRGDPSFTPTAELAYDQRGPLYVREYNLEPEFWPNNAPKFHFHDVNHQIDIGAFEVRPPLLLADYNLDNSVGLGDYAVWRDLLGLKDIPYGVGADGNNDGNIDQLDYTFWKAKFGGMIVIDVPADFNLDGTVNLADYGLWRDQLGSTVIPYSGLDVDGDGIVGIEEYQIWKKNFGATHSAAAFGIATLPGDYNADGTVNDDDYNLWEENFGSTTNLDADGNGNGIIDLADLEILQANYMSTTLDILPGDFDGNGVVDTADYDLWFIGDPSADADGDSDVDQDDYDVWEANFGLVDAGLAPYIQNPGTGLPFEIPMQAPQVVGIKISASAGGDYDFGSVVGSGEQLRTVPVANANKLSVTFSEEVFVTSTALTVTNLDGTDPTVAAFEYDIATQTATWSFTSSLADGRHLFRLADSIIDLDQESLDGDFANPWSLADVESDTFGSGDGEAGGEFRFRATILAGDTDRDNIDGTTDYTDWLAVEPGMILASNTADELDGDHSYGDVSLREAVQLANAATEPTTIVLREGRYVLTRVGTEVGDASYNDLNVTGDVTVIGMGAGISVIEGFGDSYTGSPYSQRIFDIQGSGARFELNGLTLTRSVSDYSGIIVGTTVYAWNQATVLIRDSVFVANSHVGPYWGGGVGTAVAASGASSLTILGSVFTSNTGYQGAAVYSGGTDLTIGSSIFALNNAVHNTPNVNITGTPVLKNLGNNLYDDASGGFFDTIPATGDHLGIPHFVVTTIADTFDHTDDEEALSIREAIDMANQNDGVAEEIWLPAWDFVLTRDRVNFGNGAATGSPSGPTDTDIAFGDLDITDSLTIRGVTGAMSGRLTSVRWREDLPVDAIFDLLGDYNGDGISNGEDSGTVSLGDYSIWGDTLGSTTDLRADGDDDGIIDQDDRDTWSDHFGNWLDLIDIAINET